MIVHQNCLCLRKAGFVDTLYTWSAFNTEEIGKVVADSLAYLIKTYPIEKIHLIGNSLNSRNKYYVLLCMISIQKNVTC